jgi:hypothetical protein
MASEQGYLDLRNIRSIDSFSAGRIANLDDAEAYVRQVAKLCGVKDTALVEALLARLVKGELAAAQDASELVSDDRVADAFNFLSDQFRVAHPRRVTGDQILQYRTTRLAIYPNVFSQQNLSGSRPVGAVLMLCMLVLNGGVPESTESSARTNPQPSSLTNDPPQTSWAVAGSHRYRGAFEYRNASTTYFQGLTPQGLRTFVDSVARILALPAER